MGKVATQASTNMTTYEMASYSMDVVELLKEDKRVSDVLSTSSEDCAVECSVRERCTFIVYDDRTGRCKMIKWIHPDPIYPNWNYPPPLDTTMGLLPDK